MRYRSIGMIDNMMDRITAGIGGFLSSSPDARICGVGALSVRCTRRTTRREGQMAAYSGRTRPARATACFTFAMAVERYDTRRGSSFRRPPLSAQRLRASLFRRAPAPSKTCCAICRSAAEYWPRWMTQQSSTRGGDWSGDQSRTWNTRRGGEEARRNNRHVMSRSTRPSTPTRNACAMRAGIPDGVWMLLIVVAASGCVTPAWCCAEGTRRNWAVCPSAVIAGNVLNSISPPGWA